jgi:hypothetical protein
VAPACLIVYPRVVFVYLANKPSPARRALGATIATTNAAIRMRIAERDGHFIDIHTPMPGILLSR